MIHRQVTASVGECEGGRRGTLTVRTQRGRPTGAVQVSRCRLRCMAIAAAYSSPRPTARMQRTHTASSANGRVSVAAVRRTVTSASNT